MEKSLANFAGGVMVLLLKPFKAGDFISTPDGAGVVESIGLVYTTLVTADNQKISIPNSNMTTNVVTNVTGVEKRKVVLSVGIGYAADLRKAKAVAQRVLENNEFIINEDGLQVVVAELGESSVNLSVRGWTKTEDYWNAYFSVLEEIKLAFDEEDIEIPFNYLNVNVVNNQ
jgi:small conductance mechanosensitive channel